jgi:hypothetical protein
MLQKECFTREKDVWPKRGTKLNSREGNIKSSRQFLYQEAAHYCLMRPKKFLPPNLQNFNFS